MRDVRGGVRAGRTGRRPRMTAPLTLPSSLVSLTGEVLFLLWGIKVCYNVRNAESLYNEARLISYAIYNIAIVNTTMVAFQ